MSKKKLKPKNIVKETEEYLVFLKKRLDSTNYKSNVSEDEYKEKYEKAKLRLSEILEIIFYCQLLFLYLHHVRSSKISKRDDNKENRQSTFYYYCYYGQVQ